MQAVCRRHQGAALSGTSGNDPYDPNRPSEPEPPRSSEWSGGQLSGQGYGEQPYGAQQYGQPGAAQPYGQPAGGPPPNYLVWAILSTVLCCLPLGIASIVFAAQVNGKYASGDIAGAQDSSRKAKQFAIWGAVAGVIVIVLYILLVVVAIGSDSS